MAPKFAEYFTAGAKTPEPEQPVKATQTPPEPEQPVNIPRWLNADERERFFDSAICPRHVKALRSTYDVLYMGGRTFLYARSWDHIDNYVNTYNQHEETKR